MTEEQKLAIITEVASGNLGRARELCEKYDPENIKSKVVASVKKQFDDFEKDMTGKDKLKSEIFSRAFEINAKTEISTVIERFTFTDEEYAILAKIDEHEAILLDELYVHFLHNDYLSVNSWSDTEELIKDFCKRRESYE